MSAPLERFTGQVVALERCHVGGEFRSAGDVFKVTNVMLRSNDPFRACATLPPEPQAIHRYPHRVVPRTVAVDAPVHLVGPQPPDYSHLETFTGMVRAKESCHFGGQRYGHGDVFAVHRLILWDDSPYEPVIVHPPEIIDSKIRTIFPCTPILDAPVHSVKERL
jgi:hypothetical protein